MRDIAIYADALPLAGAHPLFFMPSTADKV